MSVTSRIQKLLGFETKGALASPEPWLFEAFGALPSSAGLIPTPRSAMTCPPVRRAVQLIAESIGQLPVQVFARGADGSKDRAPDHPAYAVLHDAANDWTPASKFREDLTRDALLYPLGGLAFVNRVDGKIVELVRLDPEATDIKVEFANSEPTYIIDDKEISRNDTQKLRRQMQALMVDRVRMSDDVLMHRGVGQFAPEIANDRMIPVTQDLS